MKNAIALLVLVLLHGCASMPLDVHTVTQDEVKDCTRRGTVGSDHWHDGNLASATANMLNKAKKLGADSVVVDRSSASFGGVSIVGTAYDCGREK